MEELVSPFDDRSLDPQPPAPRLSTLSGKRVALLSIRKPKSSEFLAELGRVLGEDYGAEVWYTEKPTFTRPAPNDVVEALRTRSDAVIEALAD